MASAVFSKALHVNPISHAPLPPKKLLLGFSPIPRRGPLFSHRVSIPKVFSCSVGSNFGPIIAVPGKRDFYVRANSEAGGETGNVEEQTEASGAEEDTEAETEAQADVEGEAVVKEARSPRKPRIKLGDIMGILNKRAVEAAEKERPVPDIRTGDVVEIKLEVPENKRRLSVYKGIVMSRQNAGIHTTIRIRRIVAGVGVEIVFPLYSPNIKEIKVLQHRKVRRARLYYLRDKLPRFSTFK
ncbi:50S ribosomal protein L19-2 chloroplastic [Tripterygium wilfordii]|uniref:50S ribosomal protein L19-2 chloroplastic n=1 Tax=Tripterygium wilfordii TaxID=458696 RepID=A0A7J7CM49_TRIWF|nr:50S ribosomal protein L19-2, chloroplastic [Tripterygium wilfordii]KAF5735124.1 50S ribosomal protein L19-2 chloroplastic [Tripterygium wilfordii]